jgi:hypothetical protein
MITEVIGAPERNLSVSQCKAEGGKASRDPRKRRNIASKSEHSTHRDLNEIKDSEEGWRCGSSGRAPS